MSYPCEASCSRHFRSLAALHSHLSSARSCNWYMKGKLRDLGDGDDAIITLSENQPIVPVPEPEQQDYNDYNPQQDEDFDFDFEPDQYQDEFHFIPAAPPEMIQPEVGTGPQTAANHIQREAMQDNRTLEDDEDERFTIWAKNAGNVIRQDPPPKYIPDRGEQEVNCSNSESSMEVNQEADKFAPFVSELDWQIAQWAVKDGPGHNAFNRLLEIPGVELPFIHSFIMSH